MKIALEPPDQPEVVELVAELVACQTALYPPESNHGIDIAALGQPDILFAVARHAPGQAVGCGAIVIGTQYGELKRMFVRPQFRGQGVATAMLAFLEAVATKRGCRLLMLETGVSQPEALAFYARSGYARCGPFGAYVNDPLSVFMRKRIEG